MFKKEYGVIKIDRNGDIIFDNSSLKALASEMETPFYLMSERQLIDNYNNFCKAFAGIKKFQVFYSEKTNFESEVLRTLKGLGSGSEIAGGLGLFLSKKAGFLPDRIIFDGPCKRGKEIAESIDYGIHCFNVDSVREMEDIERIASQKNKKVNIGVRIDPLVDNSYYDKIIDTYKRKFGFPIDIAEEIFVKAKNFPHLNIIAIHAHIGSQLLNIKMYTNAIDKLFALMNKLRNRDIHIKELNIGGGFPAQSMRNIKAPKRFKIVQFLSGLGFKFERGIPSVFDFGKSITDAYDKNSKKYNLTPCFLTEPGRCISSSVAVLVGKVIHRKREWVFTDISVNDLSENIFFAERDFGFPGKMKDNLTDTVNISGPTLGTADVLYLKEKIPVIEAGDSFVIFDVGAYSISRSNQFTQPRKAVYFKTVDGQLKLIRSRETYEDVLKNQIWQ